MTIAIAVLAFILLISVLVIVHELGHYLVGRLFGIVALQFSLGFGPSLVSYTDKKGTIWSLAPFLIGGFVKFPPEDSNTEVVTLERLPRWQKFLVVLAGPVVNLVLGVLIFAALAGTVGFPIGKPEVQSVVANSPAHTAGINVGDLFTRIGGKTIATANDVSRAVILYPDEIVHIELDRDGKPHSVHVRLGSQSYADDIGNSTTYGFLGVSMPSSIAVAKTVPEALGRGFTDMSMLVNAQLVSLRQIILGERRILEMSGPVRLARTAGQAMSNGWVPLLYLMAIVSVAIGTVNLLPLPAFDGGYLFRYSLEMLFRRNLPEKAINRIATVGFFMVIGFAVLAITLDLVALSRLP